VDLSGVIFVVLAVAWAVFLIPKALKHHDEVARTRSIDRFSTAMRVLAHREPVSDPVDKRHSRLVVTPARSRPTTSPVVGPVAGVVEPGVEVVEVAEPAPAPRVSPSRRPAQRAAARAAARRRRRILAVLLLLVAAVLVAAFLGYLTWWSAAVPGGLTVLYLVLCRTQVRGETAGDVPDLLAPAEPRQERTETPGQAQPLQVQEQIVALEEPPVDEQGVADLDAEDTVGISVADLQAALLPTADGGTLWDPLPVTLPTYVNKPRAQRTVRTIDLGEPGTWTSGRTAQDAQIAAQAAAESDRAKGPGEGGRRAVGS
jgi:hypothetical protein